MRAWQRGILCALIVGFGSGCGPGPETTPASLSQPPSSEPTQASTATSSPTAVQPSATPTPTLPPGPTPDLGWVDEAPPAAIEFLTPLFARHVASTGALLQYELAAPTAAELLVWAERNPVELHQLELAPGEREALVEGLAPATRYRAAVIVDGGRPQLLGNEWPTISFTTPSAAFDGLRIGVLGDSGFGEETTRTLASMLAKQDPDLVLHTGDLVYRVEEDASPSASFASKLFSTLLPLFEMAPIYPVPGNHEFDVAANLDGIPYYQSLFAPIEAESIDYPEGSDGLWYSFEVEGIQFVMLHSQSLFGLPGRAEQEDWLEQRVTDDRFRTTIIVLHVPPYNGGRHLSDSAVVRSSWGPLLSAPGVGLVLSGHDHNYQRHVIQGKTYIVSGGGSNSLYPLETAITGMQAGFRASHVVLLDITDDAIEITALDRNGNQLDHAVIPAQ